MLFNFLKIKSTSIGKSAFIITAFTLVSNLIAIFRNKIFATQIGAGPELDLYFAAFKIPDVIFLLTGSLLSAFVLIPLFEKNKNNLQDFIDKTFYSFSLLILVVSFIAFLLMPKIATFIFSGFDAQTLEQLVNISRIMLISPILMGISNLFIAINQKNNYFIPMSITGIFYNFSIMFAAIFLYPFLGITGLIFGVVLGSVIHILIQVPSLIAEKLTPKSPKLFTLKEFVFILKNSAPRSLALVLTDLMLLYMLARATYFTEGSVTILTFSIHIFMVPVTLIAVSYSIAAFVKLTKSHEEKNKAEFKELSSDVISRILFFGIPISIYFLLFALPVVGFLLGSDKFEITEIEATAFMVSVLSLGLLARVISIMIFRIYYSVGKTLMPFFVNIFSFLALILFSKILSAQTFLHGVYSEVQYLALAYTGALIFTGIITIILFKNSFKEFHIFKNNIQVRKKLSISMVSGLLTFLIYVFLKMPDINSILFFIYNIFISASFFFIFVIFLSKLLKEKNYLDFEKKALSFVRKK